MKNTLTNMVLVLALITAIASAAVGGMYILTKEPIEQAKIQKTNAAIAVVMPGAEEISETTTPEGLKIYTATRDGVLLGYVIECQENGFGGAIKLLVGFTPDGTITKISVLEHKETPGLGDKIEPSKSNFSVQFEGKNPAAMNLHVRKDGGDVDAITASTITSRAYTKALQQAYTTFKSL